MVFVKWYTILPSPLIAQRLADFFLLLLSLHSLPHLLLPLTALSLYIFLNFGEYLILAEFC